MNNLKDILTKDTFQRFKFIENIINKYTIIDSDLTEINYIKDMYIEYTPNYTIIEDSMIVNNIAKMLIHKNSFQEKKDELNKMQKLVNIKENNLEINILYYEDSYIDKNLINKIYSIIKVFYKINGLKKILFIVALCNLKRVISSEIIGKNNVNGGEDNLLGIYIYRKEEVLKVIFHELIHYYKLDHKELDNHQSKIYKKFKIIHPESFLEETNKSIHESYTEYIALKYHIAIISYYTGVSSKIIYHYEKIWSLYQVCKILKHYKMNNFKDLYIKEFVENSHVFSYYIIKFYLLWNNINYSPNIDIIKILENPEIIKIINENMMLNFDKGLTMTLFELKD